MRIDANASRFEKFNPHSGKKGFVDMKHLISVFSLAALLMTSVSAMAIDREKACEAAIEAAKELCKMPMSRGNGSAAACLGAQLAVEFWCN